MRKVAIGGRIVSSFLPPGPSSIGFGRDAAAIQQPRSSLGALHSSDITAPNVLLQAWTTERYSATYVLPMVIPSKTVCIKSRSRYGRPHLLYERAVTQSCPFGVTQ